MCRSDFGEGSSEFQCTWTTADAAQEQAHLVLFYAGFRSECGSVGQSESFEEYYDAHRKRKQEHQLWALFGMEPKHKHSKFWQFEAEASLFDIEVSWRKSADVPCESLNSRPENLNPTS